MTIGRIHPGDEREIGKAPSMTRQHFELIAEVFAELRPGFGFAHEVRSERYCQWEKSVFAMRDALARTNPSFNPQRFLRACGVGG